MDDLDLAEVHDCFTIAELLVHEAMGLIEPGQGERAIKEGRVLREGRTPVNLSGGLKAKGHPVGATGVSMLVLLSRQLLGEAGEMQLDAPRVGAGLQHGRGGRGELCHHPEGGHDMNLANLLLQTARSQPDLPAFFLGAGQVADYGELLERVTARAGRLVGRGVGQGDRVVIFAANEPGYLVALYAI